MSCELVAYSVRMKIKPASRKHRMRALAKKKFFHWWLAPEKRKKRGKLKQLNKFNQRTGRASEFVVMANQIEVR